jgi:hypothetical protein
MEVIQHQHQDQVEVLRQVVVEEGVEILLQVTEVMEASVVPVS